MTTRREKVLLELEDRFTGEMARAAAATALLNRELNSLSGSAVRSNRSMSDTDRQVTKTGSSAERSGKQIDKLSGRLALLAQAAAVLGPALVPIGAVGIPAVMGLAAEAGALAGSIGVAVLAFHGLGDGLKALNKYQLDPTAQNLEKMRVEMEKLGPDGAHFVRFLDSLTPRLKELQMAARAGVFPGMEDGITSLMGMLPRLKGIVSELAGAMGDLAAEGGAGLAGPRFRGFFEYLQREAQPLLTDMGHTVGNLADGFAAMLVAFGPASSDFAGGLERMTGGFADWAHGLTASGGFQEFLDYVAVNGPRVLDLLGSLSDLFVQIMEAAAPIGAVVVPALTALTDVIAALVDSPLGAVFIGAAAAMSAYNLAAIAASKSTLGLARAEAMVGKAGGFFSVGSSSGLARMNGIISATKTVGPALGMVALSMTDLDEKAGLSNTAMLGMAGTMLGPYGAAAGAAVGLTMDLAHANDELEAATSRANRALESGSRAEQRAAYRALREEIAATDNPIRTLADNLFGASRAEWDAGMAASELRTHMRNAGDAASLFGETLGLTEGHLQALGVGAQRASAWLEHLNGVLDVRAAWTGYEASIDAVTKSLKDNGRTVDKNTEKGRANRDTLDGLARSIGVVADHLKGSNRARFLTSARKDFVDAARKLGLGADEANRLANRLGILGKVKAKPKVEVDDKPAHKAIDGVTDSMVGLDRKRAKPKVSIDGAEALAVLFHIQGVMGSIRDKTVTIHVNQMNSASRPHVAAPGDFYSGGWTGPGGKYQAAGVVHADEVVLPKEIVRRDASMLRSRYGHLPGMKDLPGYAGGGRVRDYQGRQYDGRRSLSSAPRVMVQAPAISLKGAQITAVFPGLGEVVGEVVDARIGDYRAHDAARASTVYGGVGSD